MSQEPRPRSKIISPESTFRSTARTLIWAYRMSFLGKIIILRRWQDILITLF